jgi:large subunit ribosomal protein L34e
MVRGMYKSKTLRKVFRKAPGGRVVTHYKKKKPKKAHCAKCGLDLKGVPRERPNKMKGLSKTEKRPQRPFGGVLCSACTRKELINRARNASKA